MTNSSPSERFVVIRPFALGDEIGCKKIAGDCIMSSVRRIFFSGLLRETTFQLMVFLSAILFIVVGVPFAYCAVSAPLTITFLYLSIWSTTLVKSLEIQNELSLVKQQYQNSDKTEFLVAEYFGPLLDISGSKSLTFVTPADIQGCEAEFSSKRRQLVGLLGIARNNHKACSSWLKRLIVDAEFRRRGIAKQLLSRASHFCYDKGYSAIEASITECQSEGKEFLIHEGFELEQLYHKNVLGSTASYTKYLFRKDLRHAKSALNA